MYFGPDYCADKRRLTSTTAPFDATIDSTASQELLPQPSWWLASTLLITCPSADLLHATPLNMLLLCFVLFFFIPFIIFALPFFLFLPVVTEIRGHRASSSAPLPSTVRALHFYRQKDFSSSLVDSRRIVLTHARRSQQLIFFLFLFLQINTKSRPWAGFELTDKH